MLREVSISGLAVVKELSLEFGRGLNVLTGETGAGKSIIVGAIGLLVGERAGAEVVRTGEKAARVTGVFDVGGSERLMKDLEASGVSASDGEVIIKREVSSEGRTRAYVNSEPVTLSVLRRIGELLVDFHGQHEHQSLLHTGTHVDLLDSFGGLEALREDVWRDCVALRKAKERLQKFVAEQREAEAQAEFMKFQLSEIRAARLREGEEESLEEERKVLVNFEKLTANLKEASDLLYEQDLSCSQRLSKAGRAIAAASQIDPNLSNLAEGLEQAEITVAEVSRALAARLDSLEFSPGRLDEVESRLSLIGRLKKKYGRDLSGVQALADELEGKLSLLDCAPQTEGELVAEIEGKSADLALKAESLMEKRKKCASRLEREVEKELSDLSMKGTRFLVENELEEQEPVDVEVSGKRVRLGPQGPGAVQFLISPNVGEELRPLARIASGGEVSRIMLALKTVLVKADSVDVMVFDEVDVGIGGKVARVVGEKLKRLSRAKQIICITHIPMIASLGDVHFFVSKEVERGRTYGNAAVLRGKERVEEVARMLAGDKVTEVTLRQARQMLEYGSPREPVRSR